MFSYRIENLRSLKDTGEIKFKPINILLGANSTGKSTFLRSFPLFKQSISSSTKGPILWYGDFVDFGTFKDAINRNAEKSDIKFEFGFENNILGELFRFRGGNKFSDSMLANVAKLNVQISLSNSNSEDSWRTYCNGLKLEFNHFSGEKDVVEFIFDETQKSTVVVNEEVYKANVEFHSRIGSFFPTLAVPFDDKYQDWLDHDFEFPELFVTSAKKALFYSSEKKETLVNLFNSLDFLGKDDFYERVKSFQHGGKIFLEKVDGLKVNELEFVDLRNAWISNFSSSILHGIDRLLNSMFRNINYSGPKRASVDRFYRLMDLQVSEVDHEGNNLAMFLSSLPKTSLKKLQRWCRENFDIEVDAKEQNGNVSIYVSEKPYKYKENVTDMGFGYSQVLPIIVSLWNKIENRRRFNMMSKNIPSIYVIEQPELHLHPKLQAKLASILIKASLIAKKRKINLILIIETHSKEIVDRLSLIGAHNQEVKEIFQVLLFEKNGNNNTNIKSTKLNEDGYLDEWPYGFFEPDSEEVFEFIEAIK